MTMIETKSNEVSKNLNGAGYRGAGFDPLVILTIITTLIGFFKNCGLTPAQAQKRAADPGLLDLVVLNRVVKKDSKGDPEAVKAAVRDAGKTVTVPQMKTMYSEV